MRRTEQSARRRTAGAQLWQWAESPFARDAASFLGQSTLFAGSVGCLLGVVAALVKLL